MTVRPLVFVWSVRGWRGTKFVTASKLTGLLERADVSTVMHRLTTGIRSEKCVVRRFRLCANVIECTCTNLDSTAYYTPSLYDIPYCC